MGMLLICFLEAELLVNLFIGFANQNDFKRIKLFVNKVEKLIKQPIANNFLKTFHIDRCILAKYQQKIIGLTTYREVRNNCVYSTWTIVHPNFQQQGVGTILMNKKIEIVQDLNVDYLHTFVTSDFLVDWYLKKGFEKGSKKSFIQGEEVGNLGYNQEMIYKF